MMCSSPTKNETTPLVGPSWYLRRSSSISVLSDDALDLFPATDEEEAELREVESYIEMLAWLEFMEETHMLYPSFSQHQKCLPEVRKDPVIPCPSSGRHVKLHHASSNSDINVREVIRGLGLPSISPYNFKGMQTYGGNEKGGRKKRMGKQTRQRESKNRIYKPVK
eukprot:CAMPEP_0118670834 /NCGR_PEP_ID=MMETSP0785-20121206/21675_1 /TAXON_ID=91992 /ORGANISM="Bolidomonas pacifica, Strain CCMP 1866" /LENGTH=165 /DNA_ID=CAMNT_0006565669 /DNA_START=480 /DNA_END=977 /DNA_ORIENTATION=+